MIWVVISLLSGVHALAVESQRHYGGTELGLLGLGLYQYLGEEIYLGALYGMPETAVIDDNTVQKMQMRVLAESLSARRFNRLWLDAITLNSEREERNRHTEAIMAFGEMLKLDLVRGDRIDFDYLAEHDLVVFMLNGTLYFAR